MNIQLDDPSITDVNELWKKFETTEDREIRDTLFFHYQERISKPQASRYARFSMPYRSLIDAEDIYRDADFGLLQAISTFKLDGGASFNTHAYTRVKGAIIDGIRSLQDFPRIISKVRRELAPLLESLTQELQRFATIEELAARYPHLVVSGISIYEIINDPLVRSSVFNQSASSSNDSEDSEEESLSNNAIEQQLIKMRDKGTQPYDRMQMGDVTQKILTLLNDDQYECSVIYCYFFLGMTSTDISKNRKISATWVSEKKLTGLAKLRREARRNKSFADELMALQK